MTWKDLTKENIEEIKELYIEYLQENKENEYMVNKLPFEQFILLKLDKCTRCGKVELKDLLKGNKDYEDLCECCYDDMYE